MDQQFYACITFLHEAEKLKSTLRHNWTTTGRQESVAEHTWRLMLMFFLFDHSVEFHIDSYRVMKIILIHDIAELVYGDVPAFVKSKGYKDKARKRERKAAKSLFFILPPSIRKECFSLFEEYEQGITQEAKVAKALDKLETSLQHLEAGITHMTPEEMGDVTLEYASKSVALLNNEKVNEFWEYLQEELRKMMRGS